MSDTKSNSKGIWAFVIIIVIIGLQVLFRQNKPDKSANLNLDPAIISAITITPGYSHCTSSDFPESCDSIFMSWDKFRFENTDPLDKIGLLSINHIAQFKNDMYNALHIEEKDFFNLKFVDQIRVVQNRQMLFELHTKEELNNLIDKEIYAESLYVTLGSAPDKIKLTKIKFVNDKLAYGIYPVFGHDKSVSFTKESGEWKINTYIEDPYFNDQREKLEKRMLSNYNSSKEYLIDVFGDKKYLEKIKD